MEYSEAIEWLYNQLPMFSRVGQAAYKPGLDTSLAIDAHFGHPHRSFKSIHIAGTNGKGSTSHSLAAVLQSQGYKVGLYTSPHLADFRERIRVNGQMIGHSDVINFIERYRHSGYDGHPSFFELTMMMAFDWFAAQKVDYAVIETGMGGRLDSTNIITPIACVITNISKDHTQFLGDTLEKIAGEKAGIIKPGIPVTIGEAEGKVREVFIHKAKDCNAPIRFADEEADIAPIDNLDKVITPYGSVCYDLKGDYQRANLLTVLTAIRMLRDQGVAISNDAIISGLGAVCRLTGLAGRWMRVSDKPLAIADTGHNEAGLKYNMAQLARIARRHPAGKIRMVIGFVADKDVEHILPLFPAEAVYYVTQAAIPRALDARSLGQLCDKAGLNNRIYPDVETAWKAAQSEAGEEDIIYIGGSTFIVADLLKYTGTAE